MSELELRERHREHLGSLLKVKKSLKGKGQGDEVLEDEILDAVAKMLQEDVALMETLYDTKALEKR